jgi:hypothetical protein
MANNSISLVNLDFDTLKAQLKTYLRGQAQFSDYDFDGSNMSVLLDILTYNSHLNAFYLNMVASEMFLDSAQLRNSVISIAKALNYTPRSTKSSQALLNLRFPLSGLQSLFIPKNTRFTGKNSSRTYQFLTDESLVLYPTNGQFVANSVSVYEGTLVTDTFIVNYSTEGQRFVLTNTNIDIDSVDLLVSEDNGQANLTYSPATNLFGLNSESQSYFVQATEDTKYEIVFGDGVFGRKPKDGALITATYRSSAGSLANETTSFILADNIGPINGLTGTIIPSVSVVSTGFGGASAEDLEKIRFQAPRAYQVQERAITVNDFATLISQRFNNIRDVYVYGGELTLNAPRFGTVLIAPITFSGIPLSQSEKNEIETFLKSRTTVGISPMVVDPDYLFIEVSTVVKYDGRLTLLSTADIESAASEAISEFNTQELTNFNTELNLSRLEGAINEIDASVIGNQTELMMKKVFAAELFLRSIPSVSFRNEVVPGTLTSSSFVSGGRTYQYVDFNPNSNTLSVRVIDGKATVVNSTNAVYLKDVTNPAAVTYVQAGTIDYGTGTVALNAITFSLFIGTNGVEFKAKPASQDVSSKENDVLVIDVQSGLTVTARRIDG